MGGSEVEIPKDLVRALRESTPIRDRSKPAIIRAALKAAMEKELEANPDLVEEIDSIPLPKELPSPIPVPSDPATEKLDPDDEILVDRVLLKLEPRLIRWILFKASRESRSIGEVIAAALRNSS